MMNIQVSYVPSADILDYISYVLSWFTLLFSFVYARSFYRFVNHKDLMVRYLCCAVVISSLLLGIHTLVWDIFLRTMQYVQDGYFTSRNIGPLTRMHYMVLHFGGFILVSWRLGQFLQLTIPKEKRKNWPWWKAPFYPNEKFFW